MDHISVKNRVDEVTTFRLAQVDVGVYSGLVVLGVNLAVVVAS